MQWVVSTSRAIGPVRARRQSEDGQDARPRHSADAGCARRRGDRMRAFVAVHESHFASVVARHRVGRYWRDSGHRWTYRLGQPGRV